MPKKTLDEVPAGSLAGRRVLVRADFNVPLDDGGRVADPTRIERSLPTLRRLVSNGARVVVMSHLGRPGGSPDPALSLRPVAAALSNLMDGPVAFTEATVGPEAEAAAGELGEGEILLLENTRFLPGETRDAEETARGMAELGDIFVNDAFGAVHRAHASTHGVARVVRERGGEAVAGLLMKEELRFLGAVLAEPVPPFVALLGGAKISGKIDVIRSLLPRVDRLLVGGAMANTFLLALGVEVGGSLVEEDRVEMARELLESAGDRILLPVDLVVADAIVRDASTRIRERSAVEPGERIGDIGPDTRALFGQEILEARTIVWNGPMGVFEMEPFAGGTMAVARSVAEATEAGALSVLGGGDSAAAAEAAGVSERVSHVSTGGGASLEFLAGVELPGVAALSDLGGS